MGDGCSLDDAGKISASPRWVELLPVMEGKSPDEGCVLGLKEEPSVALMERSLRRDVDVGGWLASSPDDEGPEASEASTAVVCSGMVCEPGMDTPASVTVASGVIPFPKTLSDPLLVGEDV